MVGIDLRDGDVAHVRPEDQQVLEARQQRLHRQRRRVEQCERGCLEIGAQAHGLVQIGQLAVALDVADREDLGIEGHLAHVSRECGVRAQQDVRRHTRRGGDTLAAVLPRERTRASDLSIGAGLGRNIHVREVDARDAGRR